MLLATQAGPLGGTRTAYETIKLRLQRSVGVGSGLGVNGSARKIEDMCISYGATMINHHLREAARRENSRKSKRFREGTRCRVCAWGQR